MLLNLQNLSIGYTDHKPYKVVHEEINLQLRKGELTCLLGTNGAGKSTLLKTIAGFQTPISGQVLLEGKRLDHFSKKTLAQKLGVVLTDSIAVGNLTVYELVSFGRYNFTGYFGRLADIDHQQVNEALRCVGIDHFATRSVLELSDGERQKVMIAKSIAQETDIILLDEPTAFLDLPSRVEIMQLLRKLASEQKKTILLSTHDLDLAIQLADQIWLMAKKQPIVAGVPEDLAMQGVFNQFFDKERLKFDGVSGTFRIIHNNEEPIHLCGEGSARFWIEKALARNGYKVTLNECPKTITLSESEFVVNNGICERSTTSIAGILDILQS